MQSESGVPGEMPPSLESKNWERGSVNSAFCFNFGCLYKFCVLWAVISATFFGTIIPGGAKKRPEHLHALFSQVVELNKCKRIYVMTKHLRICVGIFA